MKKSRELLGYPHPSRVPKGVFVEQWVGISNDEFHRAKDADVKYMRNRHPVTGCSARRSCTAPASRLARRRSTTSPLPNGQPSASALTRPTSWRMASWTAARPGHAAGMRTHWRRTTSVWPRDTRPLRGARQAPCRQGLRLRPPAL